MVSPTDMATWTALSYAVLPPAYHTVICRGICADPPCGTLPHLFGAVGGFALFPQDDLLGQRLRAFRRAARKIAVTVMLSDLSRGLTCLPSDPW